MGVQLKRALGLVVAWIVVAGAIGRAADDPRTEAERLAVENLALKVQIAELAAKLNACTIGQEAGAVKARLESAHPGLVWNPRTGLLEAAPQTPAAKGPP